MDERRFWRIAPLAMLVALAAPQAAVAAVFQSPLAVQSFSDIITNIIRFVLGLAGFLGLLALVVGGARFIIGGLGSEAEVAAAKRIIFWAIIGLLLVGMAATILSVLGSNILGVPNVKMPLR